MSKSKFNGIDPVSVAEEHGTDALRVALLFAGPPQKDIQFSLPEVEAAAKFLKRLAAFLRGQLSRRAPTQEARSSPPNGGSLSRSFLSRLQSAMDERVPHVYIAVLMELFNRLRQLASEDPGGNELKEGVQLISVALVPMAPSLAEELSREFELELLSFPRLEAGWVEVVFLRGSKKVQQLRLPVEEASDEDLRLKAAALSSGIKPQGIKRLPKNIIVVLE